MSKRHQATRRKTYGRRQHELREREQRLAGRDVFDDVLEAMGWDADANNGLGHHGIAGHGMVRSNLRLSPSD
jgi:hypothetical protein